MRAPALLLLGLALAACARFGRGGDGEPLPERFLADVPVEVVNRNYLDAVVYLGRAGTRIRLGEAAGHATTTLFIPHELLQAATHEIQFVVDPIGEQRTLLSRPVMIVPGEHVHLTIAGRFRELHADVIR